MTATLALVADTAGDCPVCGGDRYAAFWLTPWGFHSARLVGCPCSGDPATVRLWREVLGPFLVEMSA